MSLRFLMHKRRRTAIAAIAAAVALAFALALVPAAVHAQPDVRVSASSNRQTFPALVLRDGVMLAAWLDNGASILARLGTVETSGGIHCTPLDSVDVTLPGPDTNRTFRGLLLDIRNAGGECALRDIVDYMEHLPGGTDRRKQIARVMFASVHGWVDTHLIDSSTTPTYTLDHVSSQFDPNTNRSVHAVGYLAGASPTDIIIGVFDSAGTPLSQTHAVFNPAPWLSVVPLAGTDFILGSAQDAAIYRSGAFDRSTPWSSYLRDVRYRRLTGPYVLRWFLGSGASLDLALLDTALNVSKTASVEIQAIGSADNLDVVEDPRDHGFVVICATESGVVGQRLTSDLVPDGSPFAISRGQAAASHPQGAIWKDSIYVIWQDARNGVSAVYLNAYQLHVPSDVARDGARAAFTAASVAPVPASEAATVTFDAPVSRAIVISVVDRLGRVVTRVPVEPGASRVRVDVTGLPSGVYMIVAGDGATARFGRMLVQH